MLPRTQEHVGFKEGQWGWGIPAMRQTFSSPELPPLLAIDFEPGWGPTNVTALYYCGSTIFHEDGERARRLTVDQGSLHRSAHSMDIELILIACT